MSLEEPRAFLSIRRRHNVSHANRKLVLGRSRRRHKGFKCRHLKRSGPLVLELEHRVFIHVQLRSTTTIGLINPVVHAYAKLTCFLMTSSALRALPRVQFAVWFRRFVNCVPRYSMWYTLIVKLLKRCIAFR